MREPARKKSESGGSIQKGIQVALELFPLEGSSLSHWPRHTNRLFKARS